MSIKRYLFILIGSIVLVVAAIQLLLIAYFKQHLSEEITHKSQQLSSKIIDFAVEKVDFANMVVISDEQIKANNGKLHQITSKMEVQETSGGKPQCVVLHSTTTVDEQGKENHKTVQVRCEDGKQVAQSAAMPDKIEMINLDYTGGQKLTDDQIKQQKLIWKKQLHKIIKQQHKNSENLQKIEKDDSSFVFVSNQSFSGDPIQDVLVDHEQEIEHQPSAIETLVDDMIYVILASSAVALFLAFWLSNHFTRPLQRLSRGFMSLEKGELGVQVEEAGINEYRKTIHSFNQMSQRLASLAESEKMLQQQGHLAELGEVSRGLAHALRNPMHTIGLSVEQLKDPDLPDKLKVKLQDKIQAKIKHIDKTIKALLTLTSGEILRDDEVPVRSVIQDVVLEMKSTSPNVKINLDTPKGELNLKGAESEIRAIIHTLIVNAVEASGDNAEVGIKLSEQDGFIAVEVTDQGAGLDAKVAENLFQPHVSSKAEGAGMGLYISRRLATLYYQGDVTLVNGSQCGCVATVILRKP